MLSSFDPTRGVRGVSDESPCLGPTLQELLWVRERKRGSVCLQLPPCRSD